MKGELNGSPFIFIFLFYMIPISDTAKQLVLLLLRYILSLKGMLLLRPKQLVLVC